MDFVLLPSSMYDHCISQHLCKCPHTVYLITVYLIGVKRYTCVTIRYVSRYVLNDTIRIAIYFTQILPNFRANCEALQAVEAGLSVNQMLVYSDGGIRQVAPPVTGDRCRKKAAKTDVFTQFFPLFGSKSGLQAHSKYVCLIDKCVSFYNDILTCVSVHRIVHNVSRFSIIPVHRFTTNIQ